MNSGNKWTKYDLLILEIFSLLCFFTQNVIENPSIRMKLRNCLLLGYVFIS